MAADAPELTFERWWEKHGSPYEQAVIANGATPWVLDPERRAAVIERLNLPENIPDIELRRALWEARHRRTDPRHHNKESDK